MRGLRKRNRRSRSDEVLGRYGNFIVRSQGDGLNKWLRICTADGGWKMDFRDDTEKYTWIMACLDEESEGVQAAFESWIVLTYHTAHVWPDREFLEESVAMFGNLKKRMAERSIATEKEKDGKDGD